MADESSEKRPGAGTQAPAQQSAPREPEAPAKRREDDEHAPRPFEPRRPAELNDVRLTREEWREHAQQFDVSPHAIAGALFHRDPAEEISHSDVQSALNEFLARRGA